MEVCRKVGRDQGVDKTVEENNLDLVALPIDSPAPGVAAAGCLTRWSAFRRENSPPCHTVVALGLGLAWLSSSGAPKKMILTGWPATLTGARTMNERDQGVVG